MTRISTSVRGSREVPIGVTFRPFDAFRCQCLVAERARPSSDANSRTGVSDPMATYDATILPGAFKRTLSENPDCQLTANHGGLAMARTRAGTLDLSEDSLGLKFVASVDPERYDVHDLLLGLKSGALDQCSFSFMVTDQEWSEDYSSRKIRSVSIARGDVSMCNQGANPTSTATVVDTLEGRKAMAAAIGKNLRGTVGFSTIITDTNGLVEVRMALTTPESRQGGRFGRVVTCSRCGGAGRIDNPNSASGGRIPCPRCAGSGKVHKSVAPEAIVNNDGPHSGSQSDGTSRSYEAYLEAKSAWQTERVAEIQKRSSTWSKPQQTPILDEYRKQRTQAEVDAFGKVGKAFKNPDGHYSFSIESNADLLNAIKAVGRSGADHDKLRKWIIAQAKKLGSSDLIPDSWNSDGTIRTGSRAFKY
jgi:HK97 family phage prohead protease